MKKIKTETIKTAISNWFNCVFSKIGTMSKIERMFMSGTFDRPMTNRLMEYKAVIIKIPESNASIFNFVWMKPVHVPAIAPDSMLMGNTTYKGKWLLINIAVIAAPKV